MTSVAGDRSLRPVDAKRRGFVLAAVAEHAARHGRSTKSLTALDLGSGAGALALPLAEVVRRVDCVDIDESALTRLRGDAEAAGLTNIRTITDDVQSHTSGSAYDVVVVSEVLAHVPRPESLLTRVREELATPGLLIVTVPNGVGPYILVCQTLNPRKVLRRSARLRAALGKPPLKDNAGRAYLHAFTRQKLLRLLEAELDLELAGFSVSDGLLAALGPRVSGNRTLGAADVWLAARLPAACASGWFYAFERTGPQDSPATGRSSEALAPQPPPGIVVARLTQP